MRPIEEAVALVAERPAMRAAYPIPPIPDLVALFIYLVQALGLCKPTPDEGYRFLTWRPFFFLGWAQARLNAHRAQIEGQMAVKWRGSYKEFRAMADSMWEAIDAGKLTAELMRGLYSDARGA